MQVSGAVGGAGEMEKLGRFVEERGREFAGAKLRVVHNIFDEGDIRFHAANAEFAEGAVHTLTSFGKICAPGRDFDEKRIVIGGEHRAGISGAAIKTDTKACGRTIGGNFSVVGCEVVLRVLGGHATLESGAIERNILLIRQRHRQLMQLVTLRDENLRTHEIDTRDHFGHGVLDLNTGIDLDEIPLLRINVVEKFDGSSIAIVCLAVELHRRGAEFAANAHGEIRGGRKFYARLVTYVRRTIRPVRMYGATQMWSGAFAFHGSGRSKVCYPEKG